MGRGADRRQGTQRHLDNSKLKRLVPDFAATIPYVRGAAEVMAWYDEDPARQVIDEAMDRTMDAILVDYAKAWPNLVLGQEW